MADNDWKKRLGVVFSTNPDFTYSSSETEEAATLPAGEQNLRVWLDTKHRGGKQVTVVKGFTGSEEALKELAAMLKTHCGVGGSAKAGEIIIQGNQRQKVVDLLLKAGYGRTKMAGG